MTAGGWPPAVALPVLHVPMVLGSAPRFDEWRHRDLLDLIATDHRAANAVGPARISVVPNHAYFSASNFRYFAVRHGRAMEFTRAWDEDPIALEYMILKTGDVGSAWTQAKPRRIDARLAADGSLARVFPVLEAVPLPDGSTATVRVRRVPELDVAPGALAEEVQAAFRRRLPAVARDVEGLTIHIPVDTGIRRGWLPRVEITARTARPGEFDRKNRSALRLRDVRFVIDDVLVNPVAARLDGRLENLDVTGGDLDAFLAGERRTRPMHVTLREGYAEFALIQPGADVTARVRLVAAPTAPSRSSATTCASRGFPFPTRSWSGSCAGSIVAANRKPVAHGGGDRRRADCARRDPHRELVVNVAIEEGGGDA